MQIRFPKSGQVHYEGEFATHDSPYSSLSVVISGYRQTDTKLCDRILRNPKNIKVIDSELDDDSSVPSTEVWLISFTTVQL